MSFRAKLEVDEQGRAERVEIVGASRTVADCYQAEISKWRFPACGTVTPVEIPFTFAIRE
jgi:hypothetical protein